MYREIWPVDGIHPIWVEA